MILYEQTLNLVWILLGAGICIQALRIKLWVSSAPGSGLIPFLAGIIIGGVGLLSFLAERKAPQEEGKRKFWECSSYRNRVFFVLLGFFAMAYLLPRLGFLLAAILVTAFLLYVIEPQKIIKIIAIAVVSSFCIYVLFIVLLQVNLPRSFLGF